MRDRFLNLRLLAHVFPTVLLCAVSGCATYQENPTQTINLDQKLSLFLDIKNDENKTYNESNIDPLIISFFRLNGKLTGNFDSEKSHFFEVSPNTEFGINWREIFATFSNGIKDFSNNPPSSLYMFPKDAKFARVGILTYNKFLYENNFKRDIGDTSFTDLVSGDELIVIVVDKQCDIIGEFKDEKELALFDVHIPNAGIHFLRVHRSSVGIPTVKLASEKILPRLIVTPYESYFSWIRSNPRSMGMDRKIPQISD
ncbi:hypothetical protein RGU72_13885 [Undibacterium sp. 5I1]|uniref:hypothetical protein n=1 Tax=unclassified Undibacterium TaxID=2630295 RepID=UPI002AB4B996|nr:MULTISPECIES: hypothetical protein [unclassified Undibacterium]MDY7539346.1 hypothetical protein [Undibacterium sp. 5I1]MEB0231173.1 hypothetical protein [Undibacterium sp. 10I3]MEB0258545.1 hypothetical protein [Undibacterium sp. 5I1]